MVYSVATRAAIASLSIVDDGNSDRVEREGADIHRSKITRTDYPNNVGMLIINKVTYSSPRNFASGMHTRIESMVYHRRVDTVLLEDTRFARLALFRYLVPALPGGRGNNAQWFKSGLSGNNLYCT